MTEQYLIDPKRKASLAGVERAAKKIADILPPTPLLPLEVGGKVIWCKAECLQPIGAFKIRGGWHRLTDLTEEQRGNGVVGFSSGNHAQGVAWAAKKLGVKAIIIMPEDAPVAKLAATRALGAEVITYDRMAGTREVLADEISAKSGAVIVPSFDDPWVIEGQGSAGIEMKDQLQKRIGCVPDNIITCCGGGGLTSGVSLANPDAHITLVEPEGWDDMGRSLDLGHIVAVEENPQFTSCDALQTLTVAASTFDILYERGVDHVSVSEAEIKAAMRIAFDKLHLVVEPGGAVALAAAMAGKVELTDATVLTLSGGNVDAKLYAEMLSVD